MRTHEVTPAELGLAHEGVELREGAGHNDTNAVGGEPYWRALRGFLEGLPRG